MLNFNLLKVGDHIHYQPLHENMYVLDVWEDEQTGWNAFIHWGNPEKFIIINEFDEGYSEGHK